MDYAFAKCDLDAFLGRLLANAREVFDGVAGFFTIPETAKRACCSASEIVAMILNGRLPREIGRASCRERVCQYVSISVVGVSLKKKTKRKTMEDSVHSNKI